MAKGKCLCEPQEILFFPCSGGSNVGQIANQAAVELTREGVGKIFCLAGIGGHIDGLIESTKAGKVLVAIDGCPVCCAKKTLEHGGFECRQICLHELGISKTPGVLEWSSEQVAKVKDAIRKVIGGK
jgi:uncharacterized metal-binding protein